MTNLIEVLKDQSAFGFTGKINLQLEKNSQFQGVIYQQEGVIVGALFGELKGKKALFKMIFEDVESVQNFKYIVEPELITIEHQMMKISFDEAKKEAQDIYQKYQASKKLKPAPGLKLLVDPEVIVNEALITPSEFEVLAVITEWCKVEEVYKNSMLMEYDVTNALVTLRKKRAIKVFQN